MANTYKKTCKKITKKITRIEKAHPVATTVVAGGMAISAAVSVVKIPMNLIAARRMKKGILDGILDLFDDEQDNQAAPNAANTAGNTPPDQTK